MRRFIISVVLTLLLTVWAQGLYLTENGFDTMLFIIIITLSYMLCYKLVQYLARFKLVENNSRIDIVFVVCVIAFMFVPILKINHDEISVQENRTLAKYVPLIEKSKINYNFGKDFESWFNDRFFGRKVFIDINSNLNLFLNKKITSDTAMQGKDNWLFTKRWKSVETFQNKYLMSEDDLKEVKRKLEGIQKWLAKQNTKFYVMLIPDKERVYPEYYPDGYEKINEIAKIEQVYDYVKKNTNIPIIYPYDALVKAKDEHLTYYKTGTHWNHRGAFIAYNELFKRIKQDFPSLPVLKESDFNIVKKVEADVDIASALGFDAYKTFPEEDLTYEVFSVKKPTTSVVHTFVNKDKRIETFYYVNSDPSKNLKAVFYADSMFLRMNFYVAESFKQMQHIYVGYGRDFDLPYMAKDISDIAPNIFVIESGERFVDRLLKLEIPEEE